MTDFAELMARARQADSESPLVPMPYPRPRKPARVSSAMLNDMAVYRAWSRRAGGAGGWSSKVHETAMALAIKQALKTAADVPRHLHDNVLSEAVIWDAYTLSIEHFLRYYDHTRGSKPVTFLWNYCGKETMWRALAWHVPGRLHGRHFYMYSDRTVYSLEELREAGTTDDRRERLIREECDIAADIERLEASDAVGAAMQALTDDERHIVRLRYFKHRTFQEIAETRTLTWGPEKGKRCVSLQRIQKIHADALAKMRRFLSKEARCATAD